MILWLESPPSARRLLEVSDPRPTPTAIEDARPPVADEAPEAARARLVGALLWLLRLGPFLILVIMIAVLAGLSPVFFTPGNLGNVLTQSAAIAILAMGQLLVILTRGIDLSVGSTLALSAVVGALVFAETNSGFATILAMLLAGALVGAVNGFGYVYGRLPHPFIVTLATLSIARGLALGLAGGQPVSGMPEIVTTIGG